MSTADHPTTTTAVDHLLPPPPSVSTFWCPECEVSLSCSLIICPHCRSDLHGDLEHHLNLSLRSHVDDDETTSIPPAEPNFFSVVHIVDDDDDDHHHLDLDLDADGRPSPAPQASIEAIPTIHIAAADSGLVCAVCKDEFDIDSEAKRLPCAHVYHKDCIFPWLSQSNSCPLCRSRLPTTGDDDGSRRRTLPPVRFGNLLDESEEDFVDMTSVMEEVARSNRMWFRMFPEDADSGSPRRSVDEVLEMVVRDSSWESESSGWLVDEASGDGGARVEDEDDRTVDGVVNELPMAV